MLKIKKLLSVCLITVFFVNGLFVSNASAKTITEVDSGVIYYDGVSYNVLYENNGDITVSTTEKNNNSGSLTVHSNATADVIIRNNGSSKNYQLIIHDLNPHKMDVDVYDNKNNYIKNYNNLDALDYDTYSGQTIVLIDVIVISLLTLLEILLSIAPYIIIGGVTYYALSKAIEDIKTDSVKKGFYYPASLVGKDVYVNKYTPISAAAAVDMVKVGLSIYTYEPMAAKAVCVATGLGSIAYPEIDSNMKTGSIYYYHYHTANRNGAHAWFGMPYTK